VRYIASPSSFFFLSRVGSPLLFFYIFSESFDIKRRGERLVCCCQKNASASDPGLPSSRKRRNSISYSPHCFPFYLFFPPYMSEGVFLAGDDGLLFFLLGMAVFLYPHNRRRPTSFADFFFLLNQLKLIESTWEVGEIRAEKFFFSYFPIEFVKTLWVVGWRDYVVVECRHDPIEHRLGASLPSSSSSE
jgi:hypothetical protein